MKNEVKKCRFSFYSSCYMWNEKYGKRYRS